LIYVKAEEFEFQTLLPFSCIALGERVSFFSVTVFLSAVALRAMARQAK